MSVPDPSAPALRILVLEDDPVFASLITTFLVRNTAPRLSCQVTGTLAEALAVSPDAVDLVLSDLNVPDSGGTETVRALMARFKRPVVVLTGTDTLEQAQQAMAAGAQDYLIKGVDKRRHIVNAVVFALERYQVTEKLAQSEARFRDFAEVAGDWFWESDPEHRFIWVSDRVRQCLGVAPEQLLGRTRRDIAAPEIDPVRLAWLDEQMAQHLPFKDFLYQVAFAPGRHLRVSGKPVFSAQGVFLGYRGVASDITDEHQSHQLALRMLAILNDSIDALPVGLMVFDAEDRLVIANERTATFLPGSAEGLVPGHTFLELLRTCAATGHFTQARDRLETWCREWRETKLKATTPVHEPVAGGATLVFTRHPTATGGTVRTVEWGH
ncbi:response regulator [Pararhodospirillum oryzae]|uniref:Uncharacterized protein n=1 Tax=Pararhodospirillum oryzae TaxID=478448 RepID=A0A512H375_9PROT|nr:response regulator [Pararhodospirillum oryzae]GEO79905.1 hypothetical protein ROR02_00360 [Pararhodospirillum oryzae]